MILRDLLRYVEANQKILINHGPFAEEFKGLKKQLNPCESEILEREVDVIYTDQDLYTNEYLKIRIKKREKETRDND